MVCTRQLTTVKGSDFTKRRPVRWERGRGENDGEPLLDKDLAPHANKVADAINTVMASAKPANATPSPAPKGKVQLLRQNARAGLLRNDPNAAPLASMQQPILATAVDT